MSRAPMKMLFAAVLAVAALSGEAFAQRVTIVTNQQGSLAYSAGAALAKVMNEKLGTQARIQPTGGSSTFYPLLNRGEAQYGFSSALETLFAQTGTGTYQGKPLPNLRVVAEVFDLFQALFVANDSPVKKQSDIKGLKIGGTFTSQKIVTYTQNALLANAGLKPSDMIEVPVTNANGAINGVGAGRIDTSFGPPGSGVVQNAHAALTSHGGIRFLPIDTSPEAMRRMREVIPMASAFMLKPRKNLPGILSEIPVMAYPFALVAGKDTPDEEVYKLVKMMHANKAALAKAFPAYRRFNPKNMARMKQGEFHPGAIRFYKEAGIWTR